jgi:hypothetical protein
VDGGAPRGNPADLPPPKQFDDSDRWHIGKPDLIVAMPKAFTVKPEAADWWGYFHRRLGAQRRPLHQSG